MNIYMACAHKFLLISLFINLGATDCARDRAASNGKWMSLIWGKLAPVIESRLVQEKEKMKLSRQDVSDLLNLLNFLGEPTPNLEGLQNLLPKTTVELLRAVAKRGVSVKHAEQMARYLEHMTHGFKFENIGAFDENTSHIIGREWHEIDYSGENMTWEGQKKNYEQYGIKNFKSEELLRKFFAVESEYPYFKRIYRPQGSFVS